MLSLQQVSQPLSDASEVAVMELRSADALDPQAFIAALRSSAAAARRGSGAVRARLRGDPWPRVWWGER